LISRKYDFNKIIDRTNTDSIKWNCLKYGNENGEILPMWIADMDFPVADEIIKDFKNRVEHGIFGYPYQQEALYDAVIDWVWKRHNWKVKKEWLLFVPCVMAGISISIACLNKEKGKVIIQPPVYSAFERVLRNNNITISKNPLKYNGGYMMDFRGLQKCIDNDTKFLLLCSPHNPVGRVWTRQELITLGDICIKNNLIIVSDEIHCDFTLGGAKHIPIASLSDALSQITITLISPGKTFNIAGLFASFAVIPNKTVRNIYKSTVEALEVNTASIFSALGLKSAYTHGEGWLEQALKYIQSNIDYAINFIETKIPEIKADRPQGTYLLWLNFKGLNKTADEIKDALIEKGKILLNDGREFGQEGDGFFRLNVACPKSVLKEGLSRIEAAIKKLC